MRSLSKSLIIPFLFMIQCAICYGQTNSIFNNLTNSLDKNYASHSIEKVYLHTDKPYYAFGDTIWFKAYTVQGRKNILSSISGAVYVELIDESETLVNSLKLPLLMGMAKGAMILPNTLNEGNYRLRAYTQWMRNEGPSFFYDHVFPIGSSLEQSIESSASLVEPKKDEKFIKLIYRNKISGQALADKKIQYTLNVAGRYYTGSELTDVNGSLLIDIQKFDNIEGVDYKLETTVFDKEKPIVNTFLLKENDSKPEVLFFPEGGDLIAGIRSRIAVKVTNEDGKGMMVSGEVKDGKGNVVSQWQSEHAGMASFFLEPILGATYLASITFPDGSKKEYPLPEAKAEGYALSVYSNLAADSILVRIFSSPNKKGLVNLMIQSAGEVIGTLSLNTDRPLKQAFISKSTFSSGIAQFTLFDGLGNPLAERIAFIQQPDTLNIDVKTSENHYIKTNDTIRIHVLDKNQTPTVANLSVAVIDESRVPTAGHRENDIFTQLLLRSDIRGYIENPSYYFNATNNRRIEHLDLLLMTQGYRKFKWKELLADTIIKPLFKAENLTHDISGKLVNMRGKPIKNGEVILFSNAVKLNLDTVTDENGRFSFENFLLGGNMAFSIQGRNAKGSDRVEVLLDKLSGEPVSFNKNMYDMIPNIGQKMDQYLQYNKIVDEAFDKLGRSTLLRTVKITGNRRGYINIGNTSIPMSQIDHIIKLRPTDSCKNLLACIKLWVPGINISYENPEISSRVSNIKPIREGITSNEITQNRMREMESRYSGSREAVLVLNGHPVRAYLNNYPISDIFDIKDLFLDKDVFDPGLIETIYLKENDGTGNPLYRSFIYIKTKDGSMRPPSFRPNIVLYQPTGYSFVREFYSPKYGVSTEEDKLADYRSTIYWNPDLKTDADGNAFFEYYNANQSGTYRIIIEGINSRGQLGRKTYRYQVKESS